MKKNKYIILTLILSLLCINIDNVYAACSEATKNEYKELQHQYKITTTFNSNSKTYTARIEKANNNKFVYTTAITYYYDCEQISDTVTECYGLEPGKSFYAYIMGKTKDCDIMLREDVIELERYNEYYGDPLCEGIEEFVLCQEIYDREIDRETFEQRINQYKESKQNTQKENEILKQEDEKKENNFINKISTYIKENTIQVIIIIVFIILVIASIIVEVKSSKKSRRLE